MKFSFIHTADIHLGRPFSDISESDDKTKCCYQACTNAFNKIVDIAVSRKVDFVLIAGDSFDNEENDLSAKLLFLNNLKILAENGIKVYVICGNHDSVEIYKKNISYFNNKSWRNNNFEGIINITGITTEKNYCSFSPLENVNIHTVSFETDEWSEKQKKITEFLPVTDGSTEKYFNIGLIHCDLDKQESKYAPVSREDLRQLGYDYYALGHVHIPDIKEDKIVYAGSPQGRTKKETGAHGCYFVEAEGKKITNIEFIPTDYVRLESINIDCSECINKLDVFDKISETINNNPLQSNDVKLMLYEVNISGITQSYKELYDSENLLKEYLETASHFNPNSEVYKINNNTSPLINEQDLIHDKGIVGILMGLDEDTINQTYNDISELHESIYKKLSLDTDSKKFLSDALESDKDKIISNVKNSIKSLCSEIYND